MYKEVFPWMKSRIREQLGKHYPPTSLYLQHTHTPPNNTFAEMAMLNLTLAMILNIPDIVPQQIMLYLIQYNIKDSYKFCLRNGKNANMTY